MKEGCWATPGVSHHDGITSWFSLIVWPHCHLVCAWSSRCLNVRDCIDTRRFTTHENHMGFATVKPHPGLAGALSARGSSATAISLGSLQQVDTSVLLWRGDLRVTPLSHITVCSGHAFTRFQRSSGSTGACANPCPTFSSFFIKNKQSQFKPRRIPIIQMCQLAPKQM